MVTINYRHRISPHSVKS